MGKSLGEGPLSGDPLDRCRSWGQKEWGLCPRPWSALGHRPPCGSLELSAKSWVCPALLGQADGRSRTRACCNPDYKVCSALIPHSFSDGVILCHVNTALKTSESEAEHPQVMATAPGV